MKSFLGTLALGIGALTSPVLAGEGWVADYDEAVAIAKKEGKDLLVDFTGSDWCGWCIRLDKEVFSHEEFLKEAKEKFVLVSLDFPQGAEAKAKVPNPQRNEELQRKHAIEGFPTVLLMTPDGDVYGRTGYQAGGPEPYVAHLNEMIATGKKALTEVLDLVRDFDQAEGEDKAVLWATATKKLAELGAGSALTARLVAPVKWAFESDADNAQGHKRRAVEVLMEVGQLDQDVLTAAIALDPKNADGLYESAVLAQCESCQDVDDVKAASKSILAYEELDTVQDSAKAFDIYLYGAFWSERFMGQPTKVPDGVLETEEEALKRKADDKERAERAAATAKRLASKAKAIGTDDEQKKQVLEMLLGE